MKRPCQDRGCARSEPEDTADVSVHPGSLKTGTRCGSPTTTPQIMARKKRRGIIEKRRRDRINNSLSELRRLVPTAFEKQSSAKLEKAEILQMTVDHLRMLQVTGGKGYRADFLSLGFRQCAAEVSRYLSAVEQLDSGDPLHSRLLAHLAACASLHDAAALTAAPPLPPHWTAAVATLPYGLPVPPDAGGGSAPQRLLEMSQRGAVSSLADSSSSPSSSSSSALLLPAPLLSLSASFPITFHAGFPLLPPCSLPPPLPR